MDLDIHLDRCDTFVSTAYLEVHVSEEVLKTLDIGKNDVIVVCLACYKTAGDTGYHSLDRNTCCHKGQGRCTDAGLGCGTVGLHCLRYSTDRVRELFLAREYRYKGTLSKSAMTDLTASRSSGRLCLAYGEGREVVVVHISLCCLILIKTVKTLCLGKRSKCAGI